MKILVVGGTGNLGRQIVKQALDEGYVVKCMVRDFRRSAFLRDWGAELIYGDLSIPETIPIAVKDVNVVIDAATIRSNSSSTAEIIDFKGKKALIEASKLANIDRIIQFSLLNASQNADVPLLDLKLTLEQFVKESGLKFTIFQCSGFFQGLISQYAVPILDNQKIWLTSDPLPVAYLDTQDAAKAVIETLSNDTYKNEVVSLIGEKFWTATEIITLCERLSGKTAKISYIPGITFSVLGRFFRFFESTWNIADRLQFGELNLGNSTIKKPTNELIWSTSRLSLEKYLQEYFGRILKKLKETNYQQLQKSSDISFL